METINLSQIGLINSSKLNLFNELFYIMELQKGGTNTLLNDMIHETDGGYGIVNFFVVLCDVYSHDLEKLEFKLCEGLVYAMTGGEDIGIVKEHHKPCLDAFTEVVGHLNKLNVHCINKINKLHQAYLKCRECKESGCCIHPKKCNSCQDLFYIFKEYEYHWILVE